MEQSGTAGSGRRERKKEQTREALSWAALRLAVERGLPNVLIEDIATEADVSPRTFNNYFSSKAEAIVWRHLDRARKTAGLLRGRPAAEPLWDAVTEVVRAVHSGAASPDTEWTNGVRLILAEPELQGEFLRVGALAERELAAAIAERTGATGDQDLYPRLVAAAVGVAIQVASEQWVRADPPVPLGPLIDQALTQFAHGLQDPAA